MGGASSFWILQLIQLGIILLVVVGVVTAVVLVVRALRGIDRSLQRLVEHHDIQAMLRDDPQSDGEPEPPAPEPERP